MYKTAIGRLTVYSTVAPANKLQIHSSSRCLLHRHDWNALDIHSPGGTSEPSRRQRNAELLVFQVGGEGSGVFFNSTGNRGAADMISLRTAASATTTAVAVPMHIICIL